MKRHKMILLLLLLTSMQYVPAQELTVKSFKLADGDLTASTNLRKDLNGEGCALVKVQLTALGAKFEGNVVEPVENKTGEYWVYMTKGSKQLVIKHPDYLPLNVDLSSYVTGGLNSKTTYVLSLIRGDTNPKTSNQILTIKYTPLTAVVMVDSKLLKGNNGTVTTELPVGSHDYIIAADGYETSEGSVKLHMESPSTVRIDLLQTSSSAENEKSSSSSSQSEQSSDLIKAFTVHGVTFNMVKVSGGTFNMGATSEQGSDVSGDEKPVHSVTLSDYWIGEIEVTQALWQAVMNSNPSVFKGSNKPVEMVSWDDCQTFISKLDSLTGKKFSLLTEAQWEYASRGGNKSGGYKYSGSNKINDAAWNDDNSGNSTHDVKTKSANELGLYDMSGNVWEWCSDWYGNYSSDSQKNPIGPDAGSDRVNRGGSWFSFPRYCRGSDRYGDVPDSRSNNLGMRLALSE